MCSGKEKENEGKGIEIIMSNLSDASFAYCGGIRNYTLALSIIIHPQTRAEIRFRVMYSAIG